MTSDAPAAFLHRLEPEDQARADFYALLGRLFAAAPDADLLSAIASAPPLAPATRADGDEADTGLATTWDAVRSASAATDAETVREEFETLFVGVGRSEVSLYGSHYLGVQSGRPLAEIRATLASLGLGRKAESSEFEDHIAVVLETARMLVAGDHERPPAGIAVQRDFLQRHLLSWAPDCCAAIRANSVANYYRCVAEFADCFLAVERDSLAME